MRDDTKYRTPYAYIADLEVMLNKSHRQCQRIMADIRKRYGINRRERPTLEQVKEYLYAEN